MKNDILKNLKDTLDDYFTDIQYTKIFYDVSLFFDNIEDLRKYLAKGYTLSVDLYNLGVDKFNSLLDEKKGGKEK